MKRCVKLIQKSDVPIQKEVTTSQGFTHHVGSGAQYPATQTPMLASFAADWSENEERRIKGGD
jgi:hypothetical protein